mgnify:CR=1 FL=1
MKIAIGCDHGALALKNKMVSHLEGKGYEVKDFGTYTPDSCDYPEFAEALALGRSGADYEIIRALYKKATGYNVAVNKTYKLKRVDYDPDTGKKLREYEELATGVDETYVPGDLRAETFWLKNRQSDRWSDRPEKEDGDGDSEGGIVVIPEADMLGDE